MNSLKRFLLLVLPVAAAGLALTAGGEEGGRPLAIRNGTLYTVSHGIIENGVVIVCDGRIAALGRAVPVPDRARIIDAAGAVVTPGLIDAFTHLGLERPEAGESDHDEASKAILPQLRVIDALDSENPSLEAAGNGGITAVLTAPGEGDLLGGQSALIRPALAPFGSLVLRFPAAMHASLGEAAKLRFGGRNQYPSTRMGEMALLRQTLINARYELEKPKPSPAADPVTQALLPVLRGELPLVVRANRRDDVLAALRLADEFGLRLVVNHGAGAPAVAGELAARKVPVLVGPLAGFRSSPESAAENLDNAARLQRAGVKIAFQGDSGRRPDALLQLARLAVANGLPPAEAWKALTLNPAEIFSVADRIGSLDVGKEADLVVFGSDPLRGPAEVRLVVSGGRVVFER